MNVCLVCGDRAPHALGIRLRRPDQSAIWAPNLGAFLCDLHARSGCVVAVVYRETTTGRVQATVTSDGGVVGRVDHAIGGPTKHFEQERLL